jgi:hypothetical protein
MVGEGRNEEKPEIVGLRPHLLDRDDGVYVADFKTPGLGGIFWGIGRTPLYDA